MRPVRDHQYSLRQVQGRELGRGNHHVQLAARQLLVRQAVVLGTEQHRGARHEPGSRLPRAGHGVRGSAARPSAGAGHERDTHERLVQGLYYPGALEQVSGM